MEDFNQIDQPIKSDNNLPLAIIGAIVGCCSPCCLGIVTGIVSIVFSTQVDSKYRMGDYSGSESAAKNAKVLAFVSIGLGLLGLIITAAQFAIGGYDNIMEQYKEILDQIQYN